MKRCKTEGEAKFKTLNDNEEIKIYNVGDEKDTEKTVTPPSSGNIFLWANPEAANLDYLAIKKKIMASRRRR